MKVLKTAVSFASHHRRIGLEGYTAFYGQRCCAQVAARFQRCAHTQVITKNIQYISEDKVQFKVDPVTMKLDRPLEKPVCIIIPWLLARQRHVIKYATLYLERGFDVLTVACTPWQLMWPLTGSQVVAKDLVKLMASDESELPLVVHGFSVGGYVWAELLVHAMSNEQYQPVLDRVAAQVWDSVTDITELTVGVPQAVFPKNHILRKTLKIYMEYHLKKFHDMATAHYLRASQVYYTSPCRAPALFLLSRSDPVGAERNLRVAHDTWVEMGMKCTWKCWEKSPHVQHFAHHRQEYIDALYGHLQAAGALPQPHASRLRL